MYKLELTSEQINALRDLFTYLPAALPINGETDLVFRLLDALRPVDRRIGVLLGADEP